jgi:hypothetical protein
MAGRNGRLILKAMCDEIPPSRERMGSVESFAMNDQERPFRTGVAAMTPTPLLP